MNRRKSKQICIGNVKIGGDAPISVQSMCNTDTRDVKKTVEQINELASAGCEIARLAVLNKDAASAIKEIVAKSQIPLVADIHFDYRLAIQCIESGIHALRINPGNIGKKEHTIKVVEVAKSHNIPIRIGINAGSLEKEFAEQDIPLSDKMIKSALRHIEILEDLNFYDIKLSLKSSDVLTTIEAYQKVSKLIEYPLHLGVTEAGTLKTGLIKSSVGLGTLLSQGIGDTIRVSLTENPTEEVEAGFGILKALNLRERGINFISCPTCGRTQIDLIGLAKKVEEKFSKMNLPPMTIAVMGCPVNGPGEAKHADFGIAGAIGEGYIFRKGEVIARVPEADLINSLENIIMKSYSSVK
ncbi:MAG: flavodoxin-dependent (E)-4-hydroxy-3-methylbut-2-enyl-diphosphate synthase [bacterium]|nr:flavodoxin-dependent (E)-4-hydroxy-3-methylbut-2-enyl-diphosphate synthase [bacterium]